MKKQKTKDKDFRDTVGRLAGVYWDRNEGLDAMGSDPKGWSHTLKDAGVPFLTALEWVKEASQAGQRCNCPHGPDHLVKIRFGEWKASK